MRAAVYDRTGSADVMRVEEIDRPEPGPGEVRVKVHASGVNPTDWKSRFGTTWRPIDGFQIPGHDGAGVIDAVGEGVDPSRVGSRVWLWLAAAGRRWGTAAQWSVVPADQAVPLSDGASFDLGANLGVPAMTAHRCLFAGGAGWNGWDGAAGRDGGAEPDGGGETRAGGGLDGKTVLVAGGAGAVGHFAIQLAKRAGATVITTVSSEDKGELALAAGADLVVNYREEDAAARVKDFTSGSPGIDRIVEVNLTANLGLDLEVAAPHAVIVAYAATADDPVVPVRAAMNKNLLLRFILLYGVPRPALLQAAADITTTVEEGRLTELPSKRFELDDIVAAHEAVEGGYPGKVLVDLPG